MSQPMLSFAVSFLYVNSDLMTTRDFQVNVSYQLLRELVSMDAIKEHEMNFFILILRRDLNSVTALFDMVGKPGDVASVERAFFEM